jgi:hypothetical protein
MRGNLLRCFGFISVCLLLSGVAAAKDVPAPYFLNVPSECDGLAGNVVVNCGFETGNFPPWVQSGDTSFTSIERLPHTGDFALVTGPVGALGFITQMVPTVAGTTYNLSFWLANSGQPNRFQVSWEGGVVMDVMNLPNQPYTRVNIPGLVACNPTSQLRFGFYNPPDYLDFDDVELTAAADGEEE